MQVETQLHVCDTPIKSVLLYHCDVCDYENFEQVKILHRKFVRKTLRITECARDTMVYGELG